MSDSLIHDAIQANDTLRLALGDRYDATVREARATLRLYAREMFRGDVLAALADLEPYGRDDDPPETWPCLLAAALDELEA